MTSRRCPRIRVLVVDDHLIFRIGLRQALESEKGIEVVGEASTGPQALELYKELRPNVVIMDLRLPLMDGVETTACIRQVDTNARVVVLTTSEGNEDIHRALQAGACAYLIKAAPPEELLQAVHLAYKGESYLPRDVEALLARRSLRHELSAREREILAKIVSGLSNKEIASALYIAEVTVKVHARHLFQKLGVNDRTQAATLALQTGLVHLE